MCDRKRVVDPSDQDVERKSIPLFRQLSRGLIRAKFLDGMNKFVVDFNEVTMSMVDQGDPVACRGLAVVNCINQAVARGSEPVYLRYTGSKYCRYFNALEVDWPQVKQVDIQLMLFFCDRRLYSTFARCSALEFTGFMAALGVTMSVMLRSRTCSRICTS